MRLSLNKRAVILGFIPLFLSLSLSFFKKTPTLSSSLSLSFIMSSICAPIPKEYNAPLNRRVSFDLEHNIVHLLPSLEECRAEASKRLKEAWERRSLNQDMLDESIISEIQQTVCECTRGPPQEPVCTLKSCLKKLPEPPVAPKKKQKKTNKKRKRTLSKSENTYKDIEG
ncbi:hypothetical protein CLU79DRAFT_753553 [Phycomyces nitens]|nr:hypothetical protein CLU79DRAFT_753553 [Phycomyces nitens]